MVIGSSGMFFCRLAIASSALAETSEAVAFAVAAHRGGVAEVLLTDQS